jgi:hypothetical protein
MTSWHFAAAIAGALSIAAFTPAADAQPCKGLGWRQVFPDPSPPAASHGQMVYDSARQRSVLMIPGQTWEWDGEHWQLRVADAPQDEPGFAAAYDSWRNVTLLYSTQGETARRCSA